MIGSTNRLLTVSTNTADEQEEAVYDYCSSSSSEDQQESSIINNHCCRKVSLQHTTRTDGSTPSRIQDGDVHNCPRSHGRACSISSLWNEERESFRGRNCQYHRRRRCHTKNCSASFVVSRSKWIVTPLLITTVFLLVFGPAATDGALSCETDEDCDTLVGRPGQSRCLESTNTCSNPFQQGCFKTLLPDDERFQMGRICNSDDYDEEGGGDDLRRQGLCYQPDFLYDEIRVHNGKFRKLLTAFQFTSPASSWGYHWLGTQRTDIASYNFYSSYLPFPIRTNELKPPICTF